MRTLKTFLIFGLAVLLLGFMTSCKKAKNPYSPDIPKIIDNNDNNDPCDCCVNEVTVEYTGMPVTAKTCKWEITLKSIERTDRLERADGQEGYYIFDGEVLVIRYKVKNVWEKQSFNFENTMPSYVGNLGVGLLLYYVESSLGYKFYHYPPTQSLEDVCFPGERDDANLRLNEEADLVTIIEICSPYHNDVYSTEDFFNSQLTAVFTDFGTHPEYEGKTGCGWEDQIIKFRLLTTN